MPMRYGAVPDYRPTATRVRSGLRASLPSCPFRGLIVHTTRPVSSRSLTRRGFSQSANNHSVAGPARTNCPFARRGKGRSGNSLPLSSRKRRPVSVKVPTRRPSGPREQEGGVAGAKPHHVGAVVEPAGEVPPLPAAQGLGGGVELAGGVGHVVVLQRRDRGGDAGAVRLEQGLLLARPFARSRCCSASSHFQVTPARPPHTASARRASSSAGGVRRSPHERLLRLSRRAGPEPACRPGTAPGRRPIPAALA